MRLELGGNWTNFRMCPQKRNPPANARDAGLISVSGRSPGGGRDNPLQDSCLENSMDRGAWQAAVHGVTKSGPWLKWLSTHAPQKREQQSTLKCPWEGWHRIWAVNQNLALGISRYIAASCFGNDGERCPSGWSKTSANQGKRADKAWEGQPWTKS